MKILIAILILISSPAAAQMTPVGCNALSDAAVRASATLEDVLSRMDSPAFRKAMPYMPEAAKAQAVGVENTRVTAQIALNEYKMALQKYAEKIKDCGKGQP